MSNPSENIFQEYLGTTYFLRATPSPYGDGGSAGLISALVNNTAQVVNVKSFGATGDGSTDDTEAIQEAIDYVAALNYGGVVYLPRGDYKHTNLNLTLIGASFDKTVTVMGDGPEATVLRQSNGAGANAVDFSGSNSLTFRDIGLATGTGAETCLFGARLVGSANCNGNKFYNVRVTGEASKALVALYGAESTLVQGCYFGSEGAARALWVGCKDSLSFSEEFGTLSEDDPVQSTIDNHFYWNTITSSTASAPVVELCEGAGADFCGNFINYSGDDSPGAKAHVYISTPTVLDFSWPVFFSNNTFEGYANAFQFGSGEDPNYQVFRNVTITNNWKSTGDFRWTDVDGIWAAFTNLTFTGNSGPYDVKLGEVERSTIRHFEDNALISATGNFNGCDITAQSGGLSYDGGTYGSRISYVDIRQSSGGTGESYEVYGGGTGDSKRFPMFEECSSEPAPKSKGIIAAADGSGWDPLSRSAGPYLVYYNGSAWKAVSAA